MSTVRFFQEIPHIVRYGMEDGEDEKSWLMFWRCGKRFQIHVNGSDIKGTPFYDQWKDLITPDQSQTMDEIETPQSGKSTWDQHCDLVISNSMSVLTKLAPAGVQYWTTLQDYIHTPAYTLNMIKDTDGSGVLAEVINGPEESGAYELCPATADKFGLLLSGIPQYTSDALTVVRNETDWRQPPKNVKTSDCQLFEFQGCEGEVQNADGEATNPSSESIEALLKFSQAFQQDPDSGSEKKDIASVKQAVGVVIDAKQSTSPTAGADTRLVAGILLTPASGERSLADVFEEAQEETKKDLLARSKDWKKAVESRVIQAHALGIQWGGREDWSYINQYTISIDDSSRVWLSLETASTRDDVKSNNEIEEARKMDLEAIENIFETWVPEQLANTGT